MKRIYLDHSATTPVDKKILRAMLPYFGADFGNPSSIHTFGQKAAAAVDAAREQVAGFLNCNIDEVVFTSGATESDNLAIRGVIAAAKKKGFQKPHIITSLIEHPAVLETCAEMEREGAEVTYLRVSPTGLVRTEDVKKAIKESTVLVTIMYVNSEVGSIQPVREIGKIIHKINEARLNEWKKTKGKEPLSRPQEIYFHTDATQAPNFLNCDVRWNYIDLLSFSGHKIYGPKGVGVLYARTGVPLRAVQTGGHHENNRRSGTLNVPGIVGLGEAVKALKNKPDEGKDGRWTGTNRKIARLRDMLVKGLEKSLPGIVLNTDRKHATPAHAHFSFVGAEGESVLIALDLAGVAVSTGSACASGSLKPSHVLLAMGIKQEIAHHSIRFTLGKNTTEEEIKKVIRILPPIIKKFRKMSPDLHF